MVVKYPVLVGEIAKRGIKKSVIAESIGVSTKTFYNKMAGFAPFTWPEACTIQERFFPDMDKDLIFRSDLDS